MPLMWIFKFLQLPELGTALSQTSASRRLKAGLMQYTLWILKNMTEPTTLLLMRSKFQASASLLEGLHKEESILHTEQLIIQTSSIETTFRARFEQCRLL